MNWEKNISLKSYNTFGVDCNCDNFIAVKSLEQLKELCEKNLQNVFILGGGSNVVLPDNMTSHVIKNEIRGIEILSQNDDDIIVKFMSGEVWHEMVKWTLDNNYGGIENLALIPGTVGAAPIQNIGAYGVELKDVLVHVELMDMKDGKQSVLLNKECLFGYRDSIFKNTLKSKYFITSIALKLSKSNHKLQLEYGAIMNELERKNVSQPTIQDIFETIVDIRRSKLPDPDKIGNSGSFFKNIEINEQQLGNLKDKLGDVMNFPLDNGNYKIPTGWILEKCGWKGKTIGNVACYEKQALIVINKGLATGEEIRKFAKLVINDVFTKTGLTISPEVNIIQ